MPAPDAVHINPCLLLPSGCTPEPTIPPIVKVNPCVINPKICLPPPVTAPTTVPPVTTPTTTPPRSVRCTGLVQAWQGRDGRWLQVLLPTRPNGSTGFVRGSDVQLSRVNEHIDVDLDARRLRVFDASNAVVVNTAVAVGSARNPTPTGGYYVTDILDTRNGSGAYGPFALGLSAHSNPLSEFDGGDGEIGIHGTDNPAGIGNAVSHGCVRVPNDVVRRLAGMIAPGTPVTIH